MKHVFLASAAVLVLAACSAEEPAADAAPEVEAQDEAAASLNRVEMVRRAFEGASDAELEGILEEVNRQYEAYVRRALEAQGAEAAAAGEAFLAENKTKEGVVETASGLQYTVLEAGEEGAAKPELTDIVRVHYTGALLNGYEFNSSYGDENTPPAPLVRPLNTLIPAWQEGVQLMSVGSKYKFFVPSELAYGLRGGPGGRIGPNETLIFEVELLEINPE